MIPQGWLSNGVPARPTGTKRRCSPAARAPSATEVHGGCLTWANLNTCWASCVGVLTLKVLPHLFFTKMAFSFFLKKCVLKDILDSESEYRPLACR